MSEQTPTDETVDEDGRPLVGRADADADAARAGADVEPRPADYANEVWQDDPLGDLTRDDDGVPVGSTDADADADADQDRAQAEPRRDG